MQELTFEQVEDVSGGKWSPWKFIAKNIITTMGRADRCVQEQEYDDCIGSVEESNDMIDYPGEGLPPK